MRYINRGVRSEVIGPMKLSWSTALQRKLHGTTRYNLKRVEQSVVSLDLLIGLILFQTPESFNTSLQNARVIF